MFNTLLIVFGVLFVLYLFTTRKFNYWKKKNVPYLPPIPIFGNYAEIMLQRKTLGQVVKEICEKFPDAPAVGAYFGTEPVLIPRDPDLIKIIFTKDFYYFNGREISDHAHKDSIMHNLFATHGDYWKVLRQNLTPLFSSAKMKHMFNMIAQCSHSLENLLEKDSKKGVLDVKNMMERFTLQCIGACVFGVDAETINKAENNPFKQAGSDILSPSKFWAFKGIVRAIWPSIFYGLGLSLFTKELDVFKRILLAVFKQRDNKPTSKNDFIDLILSWKEKNHLEGDKLLPSGSTQTGKMSINVSDDLVLAQCMVFFAAGFETSATSLSFTLYELAKNEKALNKVCEEVDAYLARHDNQVTYDCLSELLYLDACLDETLRLYPVLGTITREVMDNYTLKPDIKLEKGMRVHIPVLYMHHNPDYFPDPEEYRPERFFRDEKRNIVPYSYMPFGEGPRICIGMRFAKMQMMAGLVTILKSFKVELGDDTPKKLSFVPESFVITAAEDINLKFIRRDGWEKRMYAK